MYSAQVNAHGNVIVCGDTVPRNSYRIIVTGTYKECVDWKRDNADLLTCFFGTLPGWTQYEVESCETLDDGE